MVATTSHHLDEEEETTLYKIWIGIIRIRRKDII
jgi:hypothetical protein